MGSNEDGRAWSAGSDKANGDFGYLFHLSPDPRVPGHPALEVRVFDEPTERHFDPDHLTLPVAGGDGSLGTVVVTHPWHGPASLRACAGRIVLRDRKRKTVEAVSFGSSVRLRVLAGHTHCLIQSPAPIMEVAPVGSAGYDRAVTWLATEAEAMLARRRAHWITDEAGYARRLAEVDPAELYRAMLAAIDRRLRHGRPASRTQQDRAVLRLIERAREADAAARPGPTAPPPLEELV